MAEVWVSVASGNPFEATFKSSQLVKETPEAKISTKKMIEGFSPSNVTAPKQTPSSAPVTTQTQPFSFSTSGGKTSSGGGASSPTATPSPQQEAAEFFNADFQKTFVSESGDVIGYESAAEKRSVLYRSPTTIQTHDIDVALQQYEAGRVFGGKPARPVYVWEEGGEKNIIGYTTESGESVNFEKPKSKGEFAKYAYEKGMFASEEQREKFQREHKEREGKIRRILEEERVERERRIRMKETAESLKLGKTVPPERLEEYYAEDGLREWEKWSLKANKAYYTAEELESKGKKLEAFFNRIEGFTYSSQATLTNPNILSSAAAGFGIGVLSVVNPPAAVVAVVVPAAFTITTNIDTILANLKYNPVKFVSETASHGAVASAASFSGSYTAATISNFFTPKTVVYPTRDTELYLIEKIKYKMAKGVEVPTSHEYFLGYAGRVYRRSYIIPPELKEVKYVGERQILKVGGKGERVLITGKGENIFFTEKAFHNPQLVREGLGFREVMKLQQAEPFISSGFGVGEMIMPTGKSYVAIHGTFIAERAYASTTFSPSETVTWKFSTFRAAEGLKTEGVTSINALIKKNVKAVANSEIFKATRKMFASGGGSLHTDLIHEQMQFQEKFVRGIPLAVEFIPKTAGVTLVPPMAILKEEKTAFSTIQSLQFEKRTNTIFGIKSETVLKEEQISEQEKGVIIVKKDSSVRGVSSVIERVVNEKVELESVVETKRDVNSEVAGSVFSRRAVDSVLEEIPEIQVHMFGMPTVSIIDRTKRNVKLKRKAKYEEFVNPFATPQQFLTRDVIKISNLKFKPYFPKKKLLGFQKYLAYRKYMKEKIYDITRMRVFGDKFRRKKKKIKR